jgi:hypothetical protein
MTIDEALKLIEQDEFLTDPAILTGIWEMLGKEGPWRHSYRRSLDWSERCNRCGRVFNDGDCPVPPPLSMKPEVVARKLRDITPYSTVRKASFEIGSWGDIPMYEGFPRWWYIATPYQQILACLAAAGKVDG